MPPVIRAIARPPAVIAVVLGVVLLGAGWTITGLLACAAAGGVAFGASRGPKALLDEALRGVSVVLEPQLRASIDALVPTLKSARMTSGAEQLGMQAHDQLRSLARNFISYRNVLRQRFAPGELTHGRYLNAGEQVFLAALDDLQRVAVQLQGLGGIDIDQIRAQLRIAERQDSPSAAEARERDTLRERLALRDDEMEAVRGLLASNEEALTQLSAAHAALARVRTTHGLARSESDSAMAELEVLSERAKVYEIKR
jgi:hypothetical protein